MAKHSSLAAVAEVAAQLTAEPDDRRVERLVVEQAAHLLAADDVCLGWLAPDGQSVEVRQAVGAAARCLGARHPAGQGVLGQVAASGMAFHARSFVGDPLAASDSEGPPAGSVVAVPLRCRGVLLGALLAARAAHRPPLTTADATTLQLLADLAAARLSAMDQAIAARTRELAVLDPAWRLPPEKAGDFVLVVKNRKQVVDADEAASRYLDYPRDVLLQLTLQDVIPMSPWADRVDTLGAVREQMLKGKSFTFDSVVRRRDGTLFPVRMHLEGFRVPDGFVTRGVFVNLGTEKRAQVTALQAERLRLLQEISSALAHQINTPLAIVLGNTELLLDEVDDPEVRALLEPSQSAAQRIARAVADLQQFTRPIVASEWAAVDLSRLVELVAEEVRASWAAAPEAERRPIYLQVDTQAVPTVQANPVELQDAVRELLANAAAALPEGGTITVRTAANANEVLLSVADDGVGMTEQVRQFCIEPFFTTRRPSAIGLGLNRVHHTAQRHHGQLEIESAEGEGTCVTIHLPLVGP